MLLFRVYFNVYFLLLVRKFKKALKNEELIVFASIVAVSIAVISVNVFRQCFGVEDTLRKAAFQVASIISTTGFTTVDFDQWPQLSRTILVALMFCGACAGSTGGGAKVIRIIISFKSARRSVYKVMHPNSVRIIHVDGERIDDATVGAVGAYMLLYFFITAAAVLLVSLDGRTFETSFTAVAACLNNIGPGLGGVGPMENYSMFSWFSKIVLTLSMLIGRLEIYPILLLFTPTVWRKIHR
jgi:trk system potassium uptake protein TrkH